MGLTVILFKAPILCKGSNVELPAPSFKVAEFGLITVIRLIPSLSISRESIGYLNSKELLPDPLIYTALFC